LDIEKAAGAATEDRRAAGEPDDVENSALLFFPDPRAKAPRAASESPQGLSASTAMKA
jgi:hypothetical protein